MRLTLLAAGTKLPAWMEQGYADYAARLPPELKLTLVEIPLGDHKHEVARAMRDEGERMLKHVARDLRLVTLEVGGKPWSSEQLARELARWQQDGRDVALAIGGPEGLAPEVLARAEQRWSLGPLTLPHGLARVLVAEQIYRAHSILKGLPYHRG
jgi:23S rRNA (pseudouridine1915-N3)-methyltransferase